MDLRNQVLHNDVKINMLVEIKNLESRITEHSQIADQVKCGIVYVPPVWKAPPHNKVKFNVDAAINASNAFIAIVARSSSGNIIQCWSKIKKINSNDSCVAEASVIPWALKIAQIEQFLDIIVEGDAKICFDPIHEGVDVAPWRIKSLISNVICLALCFAFCSFCWVKCDANGLAHVFAKFSSSQPFYRFCNSSNLSSSVHEVWFRDLLVPLSS